MEYRNTNLLVPLFPAKVNFDFPFIVRGKALGSSSTVSGVCSHILRVTQWSALLYCWPSTGGRDREEILTVWWLVVTRAGRWPALSSPLDRGRGLARAPACGPRHFTVRRQLSQYWTDQGQAMQRSARDLPHPENNNQSGFPNIPAIISILTWNYQTWWQVKQIFTRVCHLLDNLCIRINYCFFSLQIQNS